ncbi:minor capsid protein [Prauserella endophytica]|uniref:Uncharacterized protein n=1 Tax=Prauserella endophytica TaxID=1592324 RepID=A0ABY2S0F2_9PSEU|nr:minor capsid protein [Prauserella endophytica]PXY20312.1 hypothetical protein BAY59_31220 [Prauserella coralliicola]TKG66914.1 hypothetical protein FCN18_23665 [Prauserella endophytica]
MLPKSGALHLASLGLARYDGQGPADARPAFVVDMPSTPDRCVCVIPRTGFPSTDLSGYERPELQVVLRDAVGTPWQVGHDDAEAIRLALRDTAAITWAAGTEHEQEIFSCDANEPQPFWLGPDANGRPRWSVSFQLYALIMEVTP